MIYKTFLKKLKHKCPFCKINKKFILKKNKSAYLMPARARYVKNHLLVIPRRHKIRLNKLTKKEKSSVLELIIYGINLLEKKYPAVEISYKEGDLISARKTIPHMHFHLIPKSKKTKKSKEKREVLTKSEIIKIKEDLLKNAI